MEGAERRAVFRGVLPFRGARDLRDHGDAQGQIPRKARGEAEGGVKKEKVKRIVDDSNPETGFELDESLNVNQNWAHFGSGLHFIT